MLNDLALAKQRVATLDRRRLDRALLGADDAWRHVLSLLPLIFHFNQPNLTGFVAGAPCGVADFSLSDYQKNYLKEQAIPLFCSNDHKAPALLGIYVMGSFGSVSQSRASDLDIWLCHDSALNIAQLALLQQKADAVSAWAQTFGVDIHFYLMEQQRFRNERYSEPLTIDNSGSAQYMLLLDEFYRSAVRLAGKPLLWLHLWVDESQYDLEVTRLIQNGEIDPADWVDFGGLGRFSADEYFGAGLWQLYKGIDSPYKSVLKILLLEVYAGEYPHTQLIAAQFKADLAAGHLSASHHFDPYVAIMAKVSNYLSALGQFKRLDFIRRCFYAKTMEDLTLYQADNWRIDYMKVLAHDWGWSDETIDELNSRPCWKLKRVKESHENIIKFLLMSYRQLVKFARKQKLHSRVIPQDMNVLSRKLYTAFEELPGKVTLLNTQISHNLAEEDLTFIEVRGNKSFKDGWYMINHPPHHIMFSRDRVIEYGETLNKLVTWAYFNHLLDADTQLHLYSKTLDLATLRSFARDLRLSLPQTCNNEQSNQQAVNLLSQCEIRHLFVAINLTQDPTARIEELKNVLSPSDLFSFGTSQQSLVGSIDFTYRNVWNEVRTLHFEGQNAILLALKVLSNKIYRGTQPPQVQIFCYSRHYTKALRKLVEALIERCISIQMGDRQSAPMPKLRVAGKNWQFFFEERGISLREADNENGLNFDEILENAVAEDNLPEEHKQYPSQIDAFASEGFLQFFFEHNVEGGFNVYILDEANHLEIYRNCEGSEDDKVREINHLYQTAEHNCSNNPYNIVQKNFNYPQFYQLHKQGDNVQIIPFRFQNQRFNSVMPD